MPDGGAGIGAPQLLGWRVLPPVRVDSRDAAPGLRKDIGCRRRHRKLVDVGYVHDARETVRDTADRDWVGKRAGLNPFDVLAIDRLVFIGQWREFADPGIAGTTVLRLHAGAIEHGWSDHLPHATPVRELAGGRFIRLSRGHSNRNRARGHRKKCCPHRSQTSAPGRITLPAPAVCRRSAVRRYRLGLRRRTGRGRSWASEGGGFSDVNSESFWMGSTRAGVLSSTGTARPSANK